MVKALLVVARLFVTVPFFELAGAVLVVAGVWGLAGVWWACVAAGGLAFVKSFDLAVTKTKA